MDISVLDEQEIDLEDVAELRAKSTVFQIDIQNIGRIIGKIDASKKEGNCKIYTLSDTLEIPLTDIVLLKRISKDFEDHFEEWAALAFSFSTSSGISRLTFGNETAYETEKFKLFETASIMLTRDTGKIVIDMADVTIGGQIEIKEVWMAYQAFEYQIIRSAGLNDRYITFTGFGRRLVHNRIFDLNILTGIDFMKEYASDGKVGNVQAEIPLMVSYDLKIIDPGIELSGASVYYHSLSVPGRHRIDSYLRFNYEIADGFTVGILSSFTYDNIPLYKEGKKSDFNISLAFGYEF
jgi:hypothetical protein